MWKYYDHVLITWHILHVSLSHILAGCPLKVSCHLAPIIVFVFRVAPLWPNITAITSLPVKCYARTESVRLYNKKFPLNIQKTKALETDTPWYSLSSGYYLPCLSWTLAFWTLLQIASSACLSDLLQTRSSSRLYTKTRVGNNCCYYQMISEGLIATRFVLREVWSLTWWRHQIETISALLAICAGNSPGTGDFPAQRPVTRSFDVVFDLRPNKQLSKQPWGWWFETPSHPLWRHANGNLGSRQYCPSHLKVIYQLNQTYIYCVYKFNERH